MTSDWPGWDEALPEKGPRPEDLPIPIVKSEDQLRRELNRREIKIQLALVKRCEAIDLHLPGFADIYSVPNEGNRRANTTSLMKKAGLSPGIPDLCWAHPTKYFHGMYLELKRPKGNKRSEGKPRPDQLDWLIVLSNKGYATGVYHDEEQAIAAMLLYYHEDDNYEDRNWIRYLK